MKKLILLFIMLIVSAININAQQLKPNSVIKGKHSSYKSDTVKFGRMSIENAENPYHNRMPKRINMEMDVEKNGKFSLTNSFKQVFSTTRLNQLLSEPNILIRYYVSLDGKVMNVSFNISKNTLITTTEFEELETAIKNNVSFKILKKQILPGMDFIIVNQNVRFDKILNGTLPD